MRRLFLVITSLLVAALFCNGVAAADIVHGVRVVVIDAGHGGNDPGAHYAGTCEKDLTLKVALKLGRMIENGMPGVKVVYTRKTDKALASTKIADLQKRADIANEAGGDLFISIHVNAARTPAARGVETLIMGETTKEQRYNEAALYETHRDDVFDMSDEREAALVRAYLQNLQFTYGEFSEALARSIQNSYVKAGRHSRGVKRQLLRVLYATSMPGVLTEIGFLSNSQEAAFMKSDKGQESIAASIYRGIRNYSDYVLNIRRAESGETVVPAVESAPKKEVSKTAPKQETEKTSVVREEKSEIHYAIQISAGVRPVSLRSAEFRHYRGRVKQYKGTGSSPYKYCVYENASYQRVKERLNEVRRHFPKAFVVKCRDGKIVK